METIGAEVSQKIRSAIKAKLMEIGAYVDEELPDYIMVMVANRRSKNQMNNDLQLFLGHSTELFTNWLHQVLQKLQEVTSSKLSVASQQRSNVVLMNSEDDDDDDDDDFINIKADAEAEALIKEQLPKEAIEPVAVPADSTRQVLPDKNQGNSNSSKVTRTVMPNAPNSTEEKTYNSVRSDSERVRETSVKNRLGSKKSNHERITYSSHAEVNKSKKSVRERLGVHSGQETGLSPLKRISAEENTKVSSQVHSNRENISNVTKRSVHERLGSQNSSQQLKTNDQCFPEVVVDRDVRMKRSFEKCEDLNEVPRKKTLLSRVVTPEDEECNLSNPSVASVVRVKPRPKVPAALQATKNLLLKAMAEAQKSVSSTPIRPDPSLALPKTSEILLPQRNQRNIKEEKIVTRSVIPKEKTCSGRATPKKVSGENMECVKNSHTATPNNRSVKQKIIIEVSPSIPQKSEDVDLDQPLPADESPSNADCLAMEVDGDSDSSAKRLVELKPLARSSSPQFVVTLDGLDPDMYMDENELSVHKSSTLIGSGMRKRNNPSIMLTVDNTETDLEETDELLLKEKSQEKCKFWPKCKLGEKCQFHHPKLPCKLFPNCKFGDKCLYVHPNCKFDVSCTRRDCPFIHSRSRVITVIPAKSQSTLQSVCKYFPNCINGNCPFIHPKACRYGQYCNRQDCTFLHDAVPPMNKLKWVSPFRL